MTVFDIGWNKFCCCYFLSDADDSVPGRWSLSLATTGNEEEWNFRMKQINNNNNQETMGSSFWEFQFVVPEILENCCLFSFDKFCYCQWKIGKIGKFRCTVKEKCACTRIITWMNNAHWHYVFFVCLNAIMINNVSSIQRHNLLPNTWSFKCN